MRKPNFADSPASGQEKLRQTITAGAEAVKPRVLLFCRPYLIQDFRGNFAPLSDSYDIVALTDGHSRGENDTREAFYRHLADGTPPDQLSPADVDDCVARCRLLRNLARTDAVARLGAMVAALTEWLDKLQPAIAITHLVDDYVLHLLAILCRTRGIPFIAYSSSYFPNHAQLYADERGRPVEFRKATIEDADAIIATVTQKNYREEWGNPKTYTARYHAYRVFRYYFKRLYFLMRGHIERDPLQSHYALIPHVAERRRLFRYPRSDAFDQNWDVEIKARPAASIYFPLGYFPESTTDYWISNRAIINYEETVVAIASALAKRFTVAVKEHPHMLGIRSPEFYRRLRSIPGVIMVPPAVYFSQVTEHCEGVVIGGGSAGVEATLAGMPVFTFCETSYWYRASGATWLDLEHVDTWANQIAQGISEFRPMSPQEQRLFVKACLSSMLRTRPGGKIWPYLDETQLRGLLQYCLTKKTG